MTELKCYNCNKGLVFKNIELDSFNDNYPLMWFVDLSCETCNKVFKIVVKNDKMRTKQDLKRCEID